MTDLIKRLRDIRGILTNECGHIDEWRTADIEIAERADEAADRTEELEAENERLRGVIEEAIATLRNDRFKDRVRNALAALENGPQ